MAKGISIHVGLNSVDPDHYDGWDGQLVACEFDAQDMERIATDKGFQATAILTRHATAAAVADAIGGAAKELRQGDILFLTYSGHGGQVPDLHGDEDDAQDETWVLYDRQLIDDELFRLWEEFEDGVRILVLSDSCHSGSVTRDAMYSEVLLPEVAKRGYVEGQPKTKNLPADKERSVYDKHKDLYDEIQHGGEAVDEAHLAASVILISGCQDEQLSADGEKNGLFTQTLLEVWHDGRFNGNYRRFHKAIAKRMPPTQSPNYFVTGHRDPRFEGQRPLTI